MRPININTAEAIFEPFWDPGISELSEWKIKKENSQKINVNQTWCMVLFRWVGISHDGYALRLERDYDNLKSEIYDKLLISAALPKKGIMYVEIKSSDCIIEKTFKCEDGNKHEYEMDITDFDHIDRINIKVGSSDMKNASGWLNWIGMSNSDRLNEYLSSNSDFKEHSWDKHIQDDSYKPSFKPTYGILINEEDVESLREKANDLFNFDKNSINEPEWYINDYLNFLADKRYNRERDQEKSILKNGEKAAIAGIILKDESLMRLAARFALSICLCKNWDDGFICNFPTSFFNHRCFVQSLCLYECALILDLAGEFFTETGKELVLRKMSEEGLGTVNYNAWKYEYIFHCNQMAWFSPGRMYAYAVLSKNYPRVSRYMDIALDDVVENINNTIESDGGYVEGPSYFSCVGKDAVQALYIYSRARGVKLESLIPSVLEKSTVFAELVQSIDENYDYISICDAGKKMKQSYFDEYKMHIAFMTYLFPESVWPNILEKHIKNYGMGTNPIVWVLINRIPFKTYKRKSFIKLDVTGHSASLRKTKNGYAKIFVNGNRKNAGHCHDDKGSFVYEYEGETFIMDPGICVYGNAVSFDMKTPTWHNMLIPYGSDEIPLPKNPLQADIIPLAEGNDKIYRSKIDLTPGWEEWYTKWTREIDSPSPERISVFDDYDLKKGDGVEFLINSPYEITLIGHEAYIQGKNNKLTIKIPDGCSTRIDAMPNPDMLHYRLAIIKEGQSGLIKVEFRMN